MGMIDRLFMKGINIMEKRIILGLSTLLLAACSSGSYTSGVTVETHQEEYPAAKMQKPVISQDGSTDGVTETAMTTTDMHKSEPAMASDSQSTMMKKPAKSASSTVSITPPTAKDVANKIHRFGYTVQVIALGNQRKVDAFAAKLPKDGQPVWENYKVVNGTKWYTILYGDFATRTEAKRSIQMLSKEFIQLKPFVKSIDTIKNSEYPTLNKLN